MNFIDLLFPRKCLNCGKEGSYFCSQCLNFLSLDSQRICPVCEKPSIGGHTHPKCLKKESLDGLTSVFAYKGLISKAITKLKYKFIYDIAEDLVEIFLSSCGEDLVFSNYCQKEKPVIVPIPLHPSRLRWRGFNQSELLGKMIAKNLGLTFVPGLLTRTKNTKPQMELSEKQRQENIRGAFSLKQELPNNLITNNTILLFDDVWTSGATIKEAGKILKQNGAKKVWGLTVAR
jgi:competence protein ComFC